MKAISRLLTDVSLTVLRLPCYSSREKQIILLRDTGRFDKDSLDILLPASWCFISMRVVYQIHLYNKSRFQLYQNYVSCEIHILLSSKKMGIGGDPLVSSFWSSDLLCWKYEFQLGLDSTGVNGRITHITNLSWFNITLLIFICWAPPVESIKNMALNTWKTS